MKMKNMVHPSIDMNSVLLVEVCVVWLCACAWGRGTDRHLMILLREHHVAMETASSGRSRRWPPSLSVFFPSLPLSP